VRVALTGPDGDRGPLGEGLRALGVATVDAPLLEVAPLEEGVRAWERGGGRSGSFDAVAFASPRAVEAWARFRDRLGADGADCLALGPGTARAARAAGFPPERTIAGDGDGAAGLLAALGASPAGAAGRRILVPSSARALPDLVAGLRALGAEVTAVPVYDVRPAPDGAARVRALRAAAPSAVVLASPSAAEALAAEAGAAGEGLPPLLALGRTTAAAMERLGIPVAGTAGRPTAAGIVAAMEGIGRTGGGAGFPAVRPRRLRRTEAIRRMVRETRLEPDRLVAPIFVVPGRGVREPVASMPGVERVSPDEAVRDAEELAGLGVGGVILFGVPAAKDPRGEGAADPEGPVPTALRLLRAAGPDLSLWADVCLCEYTDHGHCGPLDARGEVDNDAALPLLARAAVACAAAGADAVAPSDMMDGRVGAIRAALDREGRADVLVVSYAVKYASAFYGPFRDAAGSTPRSGDRRGYQMDPANGREALREAALDGAEGADVLLVKPALAYLDVIRAVRERTTLPVAAYNVSGEYAMLHAAAERGWIDRDRAILETLTSIRRAGADLIVTYHAAAAARLLA
jgi:porphobilinogen synthase